MPVTAVRGAGLVRSGIQRPKAHCHHRSVPKRDSSSCTMVVEHGSQAQPAP